MHAAPSRQVDIAAFFPIPCGGTWHSYTCLSLCEQMQAPGVGVVLYAPTSGPLGRRPFVREAIPPRLTRLYYKLEKSGRLASGLQRRAYRRALGRADLAYLWSATPEQIYLDVKAAGVPLCVERINCHRATAIPILDEAYRRAGLPPDHGLTQAALAEERRKLALADWIFAPSPLVRKSLVDAGIPAGRVLSSSYGFAPERTAAPRSREPDRPPTFLFVGSVCIRKGAHLLLEAWSAAGVQGELVLAGRVHQEVTQVAGVRLAAPGVRAAGHVTDVASLYAGADVFVLPTFEEGSALVIYEAMAHGLPILTTPMGAGEIVRHEVEGIICDPYDQEAWVVQLRRLAADPGLRTRLGEAARARVQEFTWRKVGARRRALLLDALAGRAP